MKSHNLLTIAFVIISLVAGIAEARFEEINNYLIKKVRDAEINTNMGAAAEWLSELEASMESLIFSRDLINDLRIFTSLKYILHEPIKCDKTNFEIISNNQLAPGEFKSSRRVDIVKRSIFLQHAKKCSEIYPSEFRKLKDHIKAEVYERVKNIGVAIKTYDLELEENISELVDIIHLYVYDDFSLTDSNYGRSLLHALEINARNDPNLIYAKKLPDERSGKLIIHQDKVRLLVQEYLIKPCKEYTILSGTNLFKLVRFDAQYHLPKQDETNSDFYNGWADYSICKSIVESEGAAIRDVIEAITRRFDEWWIPGNVPPQAH